MSWPMCEHSESALMRDREGESFHRKVSLMDRYKDRSGLGSITGRCRHEL